jgi:hypothetical protein
MKDIAWLIEQFETCTLPKEQWTHRTHLTIACWYLLQEPLPAATPRIRARIQQYNAAQEIVTTPTSGYHETLTLFWISLIHAYLLMQEESDLLRLLSGLLEIYSESPSAVTVLQSRSPFFRGCQKHMGGSRPEAIAILKDARNKELKHQGKGDRYQRPNQGIQDIHHLIRHPVKLVL